MSGSTNTIIAEVIVVDPHPVVREGLRLSLERDPSMRVVAEAGDALAAFFAGRQHKHSVVLINAVLPGSNVLEVIRDYKKTFESVKVLACYVAADTALITDLLDCGCDGLLGQDARSSEYIAATHAVLVGGMYLSINLGRRLIGDRSVGKTKANAYDLTAREIEVLRLLANGLSNKEMANQLDLSVRTIEAHRFNIRQKTSASTLSELVRVARSIGLGSMGGVSVQGYRGAEDGHDHSTVITNEDR